MAGKLVLIYQATKHPKTANMHCLQCHNREFKAFQPEQKFSTLLNESLRKLLAQSTRSWRLMFSESWFPVV
jgi:hypothetical protein